MRVLLKFSVAATLVFLIADTIPFPNHPTGYVAKVINQNTTNDR
ncbi:MAG: hypothetical protein AB4062_02155 [Crocosphaera sp.]